MHAIMLTACCQPADVIRSLQQHEIQRHLENRKQRLIRGLAKLTQREQWRFVGTDGPSVLRVCLQG